MALNAYLAGLFALIGFLYKPYFQVDAPRLHSTQIGALLSVCLSAFIAILFAYWVRMAIASQLSFPAVLPSPGNVIDLVVFQAMSVLVTSFFAVAALAATGDAKHAYAAAKLELAT